MPQARKSSRSSSRRGTSFKEPAALKRLNKSLESAQKALGELRSHTGREAAASTRNVYKGLGKFLSDARRDTGKFTTALRSDFEQAAKAAQGASRSSSSSSRRSSTSSKSQSSGSSGRSRSTTSKSRSSGGSSKSRSSSGSSSRRSSPRKSS